MTKRSLKSAGCAAFLPLALAFAQSSQTPISPLSSSVPLAAIPWFVYFGTYTAPGKSRGIYVASFDGATGKLGAPRLATETESPSFLALHPTRPLLYAVNEVANSEGRPHGSVSAFEVDAVSGDLRPLGRVSSEGAHPAHLSVDRSGSHVLVANYTGGSVASLPVRKDGSLGASVDVVQHKGSSAHPKRQAAPHAHMVQVDPANHHALVADLGLDQLLTYQFEAGRLRPVAKPPARLVPGSGPRHFAFSPAGGEVYLLNEMSLAITAFRYAAGGLTEFQTLSALPERQEPGPADSGAAILVHPNGRFVYASIRGLDQVALFSRDEGTGDLRLVEHVPSGGKAPRSFGIEPAGRYLLVTNQRSDQVTVFEIDPLNGRLRATGQAIEVPTPVSLTFMSAQPTLPATSGPGEQPRDGRMGR